MKQAEVKENMNLFLKEHAEYKSEGYAIGFFTKEKGLYSGVVNNKGKVYGFVIDFPNRNFFIEGVTGIHILENHSNLNRVFPRDEIYKGKDESETLNKFYKMGIIVGDYSPYGYNEAQDVGRGILRTIKKYPVLEKMVVLPWVKNDNGTLKLMNHLNLSKGDSLRQLTGLSKRHFKLFSEAVSSKVAYTFLDLGEGWLKIIDRVCDIANQIDKERGYHDATRYKDLFTEAASWYKGDKYKKFLTSLDKVTLKNLLRYLYASCYHQQALDPDEALDSLMDYWNLIKESKGVTKYPRYLKTAHDVASKNFKVVSDMNSSLGVYKNYKEHLCLEMILGDTAFIVALSPQEIADEANQQSNCVAGYIDSVANGDTLIMFMRSAKSMDKSNVTFEIRGGFLVQAYATYDRPLDVEQSSKLLGFCEYNNIGISKGLALSYSASPLSYRKSSIVKGFHDDKAMNKLLKEHDEKVQKINDDLVKNNSMVKSA